MATVLRLRRMGSNKKPFYRIVAADERTSTTGRFLETVGWYDPKKQHGNVEMDMARIDYWIGNGARQTDTVKTLIAKARKQKPEAEKPAAPAPEASAPEAPAPAEEAAPATEDEKPETTPVAESES